LRRRKTGKTGINTECGEDKPFVFIILKISTLFSWVYGDLGRVTRRKQAVYRQKEGGGVG
jgi:hypothetical protein